jgi:5'-deoxynucleotidase YfbR-like HD superfamily hydrolase
MQQCQYLALTHDLPEIRTGDNPTPIKNPDFKIYMDQIEAQILPALAAAQSNASPRVLQLLKHCDTAEAALFLRVNGLGLHAQQVRELLERQMQERIKKSDFDDAERLYLLSAYSSAAANT